MAHSLKVIAEGVETEDQLLMLFNGSPLYRFLPRCQSENRDDRRTVVLSGPFRQAEYIPVSYSSVD